MAEHIGDAIAGTIDRLVRWLVVPVTGIIPTLVSSGLLLVVFGTMWLAIGAGLIANPTTVDDAWRWLGSLPLPFQAFAWLLFLPLTTGLWTWQTDWPLVVRIVVVAGLAGWNLMVFIPRRDAALRQPAAAR